MNRLNILDRLKYGNDGKETGMLKNPDTGCFCVQGVIADEYIKRTGNAVWTTDGVFRYGTMNKTAWLPQDVIEWSGFSDKEINYMTALNDDDRAALTLAQIGRIMQLQDRQV